MVGSRGNGIFANIIYRLRWILGLGQVFGQCMTHNLRLPEMNAYDLSSDFGDNYPGCEVIGTDISPIQPGWVPPNVKL